jgi:hypothetical protein
VVGGGGGCRFVRHHSHAALCICPPVREGSWSGGGAAAVELGMDAKKLEAAAQFVMVPRVVEKLGVKYGYWN